MFIMHRWLCVLRLHREQRPVAGDQLADLLRVTLELATPLAN
jgi:hypothetical protein